MFTIDDTFIDFEAGGEALQVLFEELGENFLSSYKKIRDLVMQKRIGQDYLLSRRVDCSHPKFMEKHPNMDDNTFCLLTTDLVVRGEAILFMLRKETGIDVMKRYNEIKKSINKRKLKKKSIDKQKSELALDRFLPFVKSGTIQIAERLLNCFKCIYNVFCEHVLNRPFV